MNYNFFYSSHFSLEKLRITHIADRSLSLKNYYLLCKCKVSVSRDFKALTMKDFVLDQAFSPGRHLQVFWNRSADLWQHLWDQFLEIAGKTFY